MFCGKVVSPAITCDFVFFFPLVGSFLPDRLGVLWCMTRMSVQPIRRFFEAKYSCPARKIFLQNALQNGRIRRDSLHSHLIKPTRRQARYDERR